MRLAYYPCESLVDGPSVQWLRGNIYPRRTIEFDASLKEGNRGQARQPAGDKIATIETTKYSYPFVNPSAMLLTRTFHGATFDHLSSIGLGS
jgi:hypothetical protein